MHGLSGSLFQDVHCVVSFGVIVVLLLMIAHHDRRTIMVVSDGWLMAKDPKRNKAVNHDWSTPVHTPALFMLRCRVQSVACVLLESTLHYRYSYHLSLLLYRTPSHATTRLLVKGDNGKRISLDDLSQQRRFVAEPPCGSAGEISPDLTTVRCASFWFRAPMRPPCQVLSQYDSRLVFIR